MRDNDVVVWGERHRGDHWDTTLRKSPDYCVWCLRHPHFPQGSQDFDLFILYLYDRAKSIVKMKGDASKKKKDEAI